MGKIPDGMESKEKCFNQNSGIPIRIQRRTEETGCVGIQDNFEKKEITLDDGTTKDGLVIYSLGNFLADQNKKYTRDSAIMNVNITKDENDKIKINTVKYIPTYIYKDTSKSTQKFEIINISNAVDSYEAGYSPNLSKATYNTFKTELENIKKILGDEIK